MAETATTVSITEPPEFLKSYYAALAERGMNLGNLGFTAYTQDRVAPWNEQMNQAAQMAQTRALSGSPAMDQAAGWYQNLLQGGKNIQGVAAPGQIGAVSPTFGPSNVASGGTATAGRNAYLGMDNPYLNQAIDRAMGDVSSRINSRFNGTAFGGTAHQQTLAREMGNVANQMRMQDYSAQMGLSEADVARQLATQQYNIGNQNQLNQFNAGLQAQNAGIANQMGQFNAGLQGQNIANQMAANQFNTGVAQQNVQNQMQGLNFAPTLAANDYADAQALMGIGTQLQGYNQQVANANYEEFLRQQAWPGQQMNYMAAGLNPSAGTFSNSSTVAPAQGANPIASVAAGALGGYGLANSFPGAGINPWLGAGIGGLLGGMI